MKLFFLFVIVIGYALARKPSDRTTYTTGDSCDICGDGTTTYEETISGDARIISGTGCPHHYNVCTGKAKLSYCGGYQEEGSDNQATVQNFEYEIPAYPVLRTDTYSVAYVSRMI